MYLVGAEIAGAVVANPAPGSIQPAGVDLTVEIVEELAEPGYLGVSGRRIPAGRPVEGEGDTYNLPPGAYRVGFSEEVRVPPWGVGFCYPRSSLLRMGAALACAVWDPGYRGRGYALLVVHNPHGIRVERGARIAQLVVARLDTIPDSTYEGVYQGERLPKQ